MMWQKNGTVSGKSLFLKKIFFLFEILAFIAYNTVKYRGEADSSLIK